MLILRSDFKANRIDIEQIMLRNQSVDAAPFANAEESTFRGVHLKRWVSKEESGSLWGRGIHSASMWL